MGQQTAPGVWSFEGPGGVQLQGRGATEAAAKVDAVNTYNRQATLATAPTGGKATKPPDIVGRIKQAILGEMNPAETGAALVGADPRTPGGVGTTIKEGARAVGDVMLPGSIEDAVIQMAAGGAGAVGGALSKGMGKAGTVATRAATEVGMPAAAGAGAAALTGEDAGKAALAGGTAGAVTGLLAGPGSAVGAFLKRSKSLNDIGQQRAIRNTLGPELAKSIQEDIPALGGKVKNLADVQLLRTEQGGRKILGGMFDVVEAQIEKQAGTVKLTPEIIIAAGRTPVAKKVPTPESMRLAQSIADELKTTVDDPKVIQHLESITLRKGIPATEYSSVSEVPVKEAIDIAKRLRNMSLKKGEALPGHDPRVLAEAAQEAITAAIPQPLAERYAALQKDYSKFMRLRNEVLEKGGEALFPRMTEGGATIDLVKFHKQLMDNLDSVPPQEFPALHRFFSGGDELGTGPTTAAGRRFSVSPGMGVHVGVHVKDKLQLPAGTKEKIQPTSRVPGVLGGVGRAGGVAAAPSIRQGME